MNEIYVPVIILFSEYLHGITERRRNSIKLRALRLCDLLLNLTPNTSVSWGLVWFRFLIFGRSPDVSELPLSQTNGSLSVATVRDSVS